VDSPIENSIPQLQPASKQGPGLPSATTPNERTTHDVVISMMEKLDKRLNDMEGKISSKASARVEADNTIQQDVEMEEQSQQLQEVELEALDWMDIQCSKLRDAYKAPANFPPLAVIEYVAKEMTKDPDSAEGLKSRIHHLVMKYKEVVKQISPEFDLDEIRSRGYKKMLEMANMESHLLNFALGSKDRTSICTKA